MIRDAEAGSLPYMFPGSPIGQFRPSPDFSSMPEIAAPQKRLPNCRTWDKVGDESEFLDLHFLLAGGHRCVGLPSSAGGSVYRRAASSSGIPGVGSIAQPLLGDLHDSPVRHGKWTKGFVAWLDGGCPIFL